MGTEKGEGPAKHVSTSTRSARVSDPAENGTYCQAFEGHVAGATCYVSSQLLENLRDFLLEDHLPLRRQDTVAVFLSAPQIGKLLGGG